MAFTTVNDISAVDIGYSRTGAQKFMTKLRTELIPTAKDKLRNGLNTLESEITPHWGGVAPERFIKNMDTGVGQVCDLLDQLSESLQEVFDGLHSSWVESDENLVSSDETPF